MLNNIHKNTHNHDRHKIATGPTGAWMVQALCIQKISAKNYQEQGCQAIRQRQVKYREDLKT
jgi:hypothetical protein